MLVLEWKERAFIEKVNSRCFCWFPAAILVHQNGAPIWRLHTKLYKGAWNVSANNSETVGHKDLRLGQIVYILVFSNISFSWLLPPVSNLIFCCVTVKTIYSFLPFSLKSPSSLFKLPICPSGGNKLSAVRSLIILQSREGLTSFNKDNSANFSVESKVQ